jgi:hypothetical protein
LLHAGGDGGIKDTRGTGDRTLERFLFFWRLENMNLNLGTGITHVEDHLRGGCIGERGRDMHNDINT